MGFGFNDLPELVLVVFSLGFSMFAVWALVSMTCLSWFWLLLVLVSVCLQVKALVSMICLSWLVVFSFGVSMFTVWALPEPFCCFSLSFGFSMLAVWCFGFNDMPELVLVVFSCGFNMFPVWALASVICMSWSWLCFALVSVCVQIGLWFQ